MRAGLLVGLNYHHGARQPADKPIVHREWKDVHTLSMPRACAPVVLGREGPELGRGGQGPHPEAVSETDPGQVRYERQRNGLIKVMRTPWGVSPAALNRYWGGAELGRSPPQQRAQRWHPTSLS